jgi:SAM-dependent methyltransferase
VRAHGVKLKSVIKQNFPAAISLYHWSGQLPRRLLLRFLPREAVFTRRYRQGGWQGDESVSGLGSGEEQTRAIRSALPRLLQETGARSLLDIPCGDFNWMEDVELGVERYIGADIVDDLVAENRRRFADDRHEFVKIDVVRDRLPEVDVVFCRDCLVHLSSSDVLEALRNIKSSGSRHLLTTTFTGRAENEEILTGEWRPINLEKAPFCLPAPLTLVDEGCTEYGGRYADKSLGLWRIADLPV